MESEKADKQFAITVGVFLLLIMTGLIALTTINNQKSTLTETPVVANQTGTSKPRIHTSFYPEFTSFTALLDAGITHDQLTGLQYAFYRYEQASHATFKKITLNRTSITTPPRDPNKPISTNSIRFAVQIDEASYNAHINYSGLSNIELLLSNSRGSQVYDSGTININTQSPKID